MALIVPDVKMDFKEMISKFAIPTDLKVDLIYCQQKIIQFLKLHKILSSHAQSAQNKIKEYSLRKSVHEVEREICDISCDQRLLTGRLRESLEEYYVTLKKESIEIDRELGNIYVGQQLRRLIDNSYVITQPFNVKKRTPKKEILAKAGLISDRVSPGEDKKNVETVETILSTSPIGPAVAIKQESLLKPKAERIGMTKPFNAVFISDCKDMKDIKDSSLKGNDKAGVSGGPPPPTRNIRNSRLNLLQALNKAKTQSMNMAAKVQSPMKFSRISPDKCSEGSSSSSSSSSASSSSSSHSAASQPSPSLSNSDDSLDAVPMASPTYSDEHKNLDLIATDKEAFLRQFGLFTQEYSRALSQRRSKRRKRNVQSNEKSDFHYGNLDLFDRMDRKKKTFLYSPPSTRSLKRKKVEMENSDERESNTKTFGLESRSTSSSPEHKYLCNECFKAGDEALLQCINCTGPFHLKCHRGSISKNPLRLRSKMCPACLRNRNKDTNAESQYQLRDKAMREQMKQENMRLKASRKNLWKDYIGYDKKTMDIQNNKGKLLKHSEMLKTKMANFINIVHSFKS